MLPVLHLDLVLGSPHSIKAARHATKYHLLSRILDPTSPDAGACGIAPRDALGLRLRHTAIDAYLVAIGAFYQTRRKPMPLPLGERRLLGSRGWQSCRGHNPKHRQGRHRYFAKIRHYPKGRTVHRPASITFRRPQKTATPIAGRKNIERPAATEQRPSIVNDEVRLSNLQGDSPLRWGRCLCQCVSADNRARRSGTNGSHSLRSAVCAFREHWRGCDFQKAD